MNQSSSGFCLKKTLANNNGFSVKTLLIILLLLVSVLGYLYLFTGLFGNHAKVPVEPAPAVVVKKPMPPRPQLTGEDKTDTAETVVQEGVAPPIAQPATVQPKPVEHPAIDIKPKPEQIPTKRVIVKPVAAEQKAKLQPKTKPAVKEPQPEPVPKPKPAITVKAQAKAVPVKEVKTGTASPVKPATSTATTGSKEKFTLLIGVYVLDKSMASEKAKLNAAGLTPVTSKGPIKMEPMSRLFVAEFDNRAQATDELLKLRKITGDAFILPGKDKYAVYAGSYFDKERADSELSRLQKQGVKSVLQITTAPVSTKRLTAGSFSTRKEAEEKSLSLKKLGINAVIIRPGA
jgi:cell division protein FtsN